MLDTKSSTTFSSTALLRDRETYRIAMQELRRLGGNSAIQWLESSFYLLGLNPQMQQTLKSNTWIVSPHAQASEILRFDLESIV